MKQGAIMVTIWIKLTHGLIIWFCFFQLSAATAAFSLQFTARLLAAEHFRLLALRCGTACHRRLRQHRLWRPSALESRRFSLLNHILTFGWS